MQLGTRWRVGAQAPDRLSDGVLAAVRGVEAELVDEGVNTADWYWTLTYLEGRPVVELDDGTRITVAAISGEVIVSASPDDLDSER